MVVVDVLGVQQDRETWRYHLIPTTGGQAVVEVEIGQSLYFDEKAELLLLTKEGY